MKKLLYTFLAVSIIFAACKKEDEVTTSVTNPVAASIVGIWTPTSADKDSSLTTTIAGEIVYEFDFGDGPEVLSYPYGSETMTPAEADFTGNMEFTSDGKMFVDGDTMDYTYSNSELIVTDADTTTILPCLVTSTSLSFTFAQSMDTAFTEPMFMLFGFANGDITVNAYSGVTIHCSRNTAISTNVNQRIGNTNNSWFVKPKFNIVKLLNSIKQK